MTGLHWAAERGDDAMVQVLLSTGAAVDGRTRIGDYTPLHLAARSGSGAVVSALLKAGARADASTSTSGVQPIHLAAGSGSVSAVTALLDKGAGINSRESEWGQTPLIFAAAANRPEVVQLLIKRGADVHLKTNALDVAKFSTEARQAQTLQRSILRSAVAAGEEPTPSQWRASVEAVREYYATGKLPAPPAAAAPAGGRAGAPAGAPGAPAAPAAAPRDVNEDGPPPNIAAKGGLSALHHAARQGFVDVAKALLDAGASLNEKTGDGHQPVLVALINGQVMFYPRYQGCWDAYVP